MSASSKPDEKPVENPNREEQRTGHQEAPHPLAEASKDVGQPGTEASDRNYCSHVIPLKRQIFVAVVFWWTWFI
jgi:hypothetical protein